MLKGSMKKSLKRRIDVSFILLFTVSLLIIGVVSALFIEKVYIQDRKGILVDSFTMLADSQTTENVVDFANYCAKTGLSFVIADENLTPLATNAQDPQDMVNLIFGSLMEMDTGETDMLEETEQYQVICMQDKTDNIEFLALVGQMSNGYYYVARYPMSSIQDAARLTIVFYVILGLIMLGASAFMIRQITKRLTKPIVELNRVAGRMAELDFEARYTSGGEDEIGQLGENINAMSSRLESTISELKSANAQLEKDIEAKERLNEKRREFLSNVSHELKTPIALVQGYAEGLKEMQQDAESRDYYCDVIIDEANRMNRLVRQILSLDQLESGSEQLDFTRFDLAELIHGVVNASAILIEQKQAQVRIDIPAPMYAWGDEFKIEQVLTNYLSNALNHLEGERIIHINCAEEGGIVTTTVFNTGTPIPEEELDNIWSKFYKVDKARTREYGGSGIGLSIVKAIMDLHRQKCWAENYENGVAFKFTLTTK